MSLFNRLTPKVGFSISIFSLICGTALALAKEPQLWYIPFVCSFPTILIFLFTIKRWKPIPMRKPDFLNENKACQILYEAVSMNPLENPFCWHLTIMHANGTAIAAKLAETISSSIEHLQEMTIGRIGNMIREKLCVIDKMKYHLDRIRRIDAILTGIITEANTGTKSYRCIEDGNKVYNLLRESSNLLRTEIIDKMDSFYTKIPLKVDKELENYYLLSLDDSELSENARKWKSRIEPFMKQEIPGQLAIAEKNLIEADKLATKVLDNIRKDWFNDLKFVWNDPVCKIA